MTNQSVRSVILLFLRQELVWQHKGEMLGKLWLVLQPLTYIFIFMTIFSRIMGAKLSLRIDSALPAAYAYSIYLVSGLLAWQMFANTLQGMADVYQQKASIIRKVPMPLRWMPLYVPIRELITYAISLILFLLYLLALHYAFSWQHLLVPVVILLLIVLAYALGLIFASISVFIPDIRRMLALLLQLAFWATPIVYVSDILPHWAGPIVTINPVYWGIGALQNIFLEQPVNYARLLWLTGLDVALVLIAFWINGRLEKDIRDLV
jgi:lipopolysaccharide transport system permease protein